MSDDHVINCTTKDDFEQALADAGEKLCVVDFFATWCGPCRMIAPKIHAMAEEFEDESKILI